MELVIFVGLQGSGKSTLYRTHFAETHVHVSKDNFPNARHRDRRQALLIEEALRAGRSVVVDNTHPTRSDRAGPIALARAYGARVVGYYFDTSVNECLARNRARQGRARVPDVAIFATAKKLERPALDEGFDALYRVRLSNGQRFEITPLMAET